MRKHPVVVISVCEAGPLLSSPEEDDDEDEDDAADRADRAHLAAVYPPLLYLPMDRQYEAKYLQHLRKHTRRSWQERVYTFLEHPAGWACSIYHFSV